MRLAALAVALSVLMANRSFANRIVVRAPNCAAKSTAVVQRAIDEASESGGGEVVLSGGTFLCGSLYLKSNVSLTIAADAVLKASPDRADYNAAANASHELKTPLAVIRSNTEMEEIVSGESEWTQSTIRQVDRMNSLIQNLVMISKSREMEGRTELAKINASEAVAQTARDFASRAETEGKTLLQDIVPDLELTADGSQLRQLTMILLDNAVKYCDANGNIAIRLEPAAKWGKKGIRLTVSNDYAAGKDVDYTRFFDRFYREDKSHNIDTGGYGIGLSIAEHICEQYKGSIRADWRDGKIFFICDLF